MVYFDWRYKRRRIFISDRALLESTKDSNQTEGHSAPSSLVLYKFGTVTCIQNGRRHACVSRLLQTSLRWSRFKLKVGKNLHFIFRARRGKAYREGNMNIFKEDAKLGVALLLWTWKHSSDSTKMANVLSCYSKNQWLRESSNLRAKAYRNISKPGRFLFESIVKWLSRKLGSKTA